MALLIPPDADRDGYHWVRRFRGGPVIPLWWCAEWRANGGQGWGRHGQPEREDQWEYIAHCPMPETQDGSSL